MIAGICILSLFGVGDIFLIRKIILLSGVLLFSLAIVEEVEEEVPKHYMMVGRKQRLFLSIAAAMVFLQAGRINIAMDYDTLHYSVRSQYVLNAGLGIYENLGMNNVVYTYPKGLEILTMPFADLKSYSYIPAFNLWVTVGTLVCIYMLVRHLSSRRAAWRTVAVAACIPAIMNMGASAKTDAITLFFQLMAIYFVMQYMREKRQPYLLMGGSALILSYAMKPTAVVFSSLVLVVSVVCLVKHKLVKIRLADRWWILVIPEVLALIGVWARTFFLTGVPVTSVFTGLLNKIGFKLRYPFNAAEVPNSGGELLSAEGWINLVKRLFGVLIAPVGEDMAHVVIAWGSGAHTGLSGGDRAGAAHEDDPGGPRPGASAQVRVLADDRGGACQHCQPADAVAGGRKLFHAVLLPGGCGGHGGARLFYKEDASGDYAAAGGAHAAFKCGGDDVHQLGGSRGVLAGEPGALRIF